MFIDRFCETEYDSYESFRDNFKIKVPENFNFGYDVIDELAVIRPESLAFIWCNDRGDEKRVTFAQLKTLTDKCANMLDAHGIGRGDIVMTLVRCAWQYWIIAIAAHKLGAVLLPAVYQLMTKDLVYRFQSSKAKAVVCADIPELRGHVLEACEICGGPDIRFGLGGSFDGFEDFDSELESAPEAFERRHTENDDPFLIFFTSGTAGNPKMVTHDFRYPLGHILTAKFWQDIQPGDLHYTHADTGWAKTSWGKIYGQWICEATLMLYDCSGRFHPTDILELVQKYRVNVLCGPATVYRFLIKEDMSMYDLSSLRHCCIAGEPLNGEVYNKWKEYTGLELREGFGMSETAVLAANFPWMKVKPCSMGKPSPHFNIKLIGDDGAEVERGDEGEICIPVANGSPAGLTVGYYKDPQKTEMIIHGGYFHTGDVAWMDEDGYLWFVGRSDDVIKSSGYRIGPFEVESALMTHPAVLEAAITAMPDPDRGQIVKAYIVLAKGFTASDALKKELQDHVKRTTAPYKYPRVIEFVSELPKTASDKIKRSALRSRDAEKANTQQGV
ncbi:MAG: AMP-binding protein [Clostridiales bacterium]|nr:AMP-binding protein [Clostridiales bacterium]